MTFLPFLPEFRDAIIERRKTMTARPRRYGKPGEVVDSPFGKLQLVQVSRARLGAVAERHYREEGVSSPSAFRVVWERCYPQHAFDPGEEVWLHEFKLLAPGEELGLRRARA